MIAEADGVSHEEVLKSPYKWMADNPQHVIMLQAHGNERYQEVVTERLIRLNDIQEKRDQEIQSN